jgi:hypothetical protein
VRVSAIIPATDAPRTLERCVQALEQADRPPDEILVVATPSGCGPALARNLGATGASGEVLLFVDADIVVHPDAVGRVREAFAQDDGLTAVFGSYDDEPEHTELVSAFRNLLHHHVHQSGAGDATTFWAGLGAVRRAAFMDVGGFDADRFPAPSIEDIDLGMRLHARRGRIRLDPHLQGTHLKRWRLSSMIVTDFWRRGVPWVQLRLAARGTPRSLNLGLRHRVSAALVVTVVATFPRHRSMAAASAAAFVLLNGHLYSFLLRKGGVPLAAAGIPLHALHHLAAAASVPVGVALYARRAVGYRR